MKNLTTRIEGQGPFHLLPDPVYGPQSKYFWPGSRWDASGYVLTPVRISPYVSGEDFLEIYDDTFSGVLDYRESTDYPEESYCDTLYDHFHRLYSSVESWDRTTLFVSAVYRGIFHQMFPYDSQILELRTDLGYGSTIEPYLREGKSEEEAVRAAYGESFKEVEKGERNLSVSTCRGLISLIFYPYTDKSLISELIKVLHRTNTVANHQEQLQEGFLVKLKHPRPLALLTDERRQDRDREKLVLGLSLLQIEPKAAEKAVDDSFLSRSYEPITHLIHQLIRDRPSKRGFAGDEASAYRLGPHYTATDYINDLVLSEEAYDRIFEEVRNSAAELRITSVLMSFEEEGGKLAELAFSKMIRELFQENTNQEDTPLLSIVKLAAKSLDEDDLLLSEERIDVPWQARERIVEICKKCGIPDNEALAKQIISQVRSGPDPTNKFSQDKSTSAREQLVKAFGSLIVIALAYILPKRSKAMVSGPNLPRIGMYADETGGAPFGKMASLSSVQLNRTQPQTNQVLRQPTVASAQKKGLDAEKLVFLKTEKAEKKFDDIYIHGTFNKTIKEITMEGSCGPAHRLEQLRKGPVARIAHNMGYTVGKIDLDHHLSSRVRQGLYHFTEREYDPSIVEAIDPKIHKLLTAKGPNMFLLPEGRVSFDRYLNQILTKRMEVFKSSEGQAIMTEERRFKSEDYIAWSQRGSTWNRRFFRYIAEQQGVGEDCVKSLLYPKQIYDDADGDIKRLGLHIRLAASNTTVPSDLKETQALLTETIEEVSTRISLLAHFRDSLSRRPGVAPSFARGVARDMAKLVLACNQLTDLANDLYKKSRFTGSGVQVPPVGRIVSLDETIAYADDEGYRDQWRLRGATAETGNFSETSNSSLDILKRYNHLILTTTGLVNEPSMSQPMKELTNAPLVGQRYNVVDEGFLN